MFLSCKIIQRVSKTHCSFGSSLIPTSVKFSYFAFHLYQKPSILVIITVVKFKHQLVNKGNNFSFFLCVVLIMRYILVRLSTV